jgi:Tfp pilus assembly protein PilF
MSLLIKALEQAAKDRKTTRVEPQPLNEGADTSAEPTLEPPPPPRVRAAVTRPSEEPPAAEPTPSGAATAKATAPSAAAPAAASLAFERPATQPRAAGSLAELARNDARQQRARAAAVVQAAGGSAANAMALLRANPVMLFGAAAIFFGIGFGIYVYIQIAHPGLFQRTATVTRSGATEKPAAAQAPVRPTADAQPLPAAVPQQPTSMAPAAPAPSVAVSEPAAPAPSAGTIAPPAAETSRTAASAPVPTAAVVASAPIPETSRAPEKERANVAAQRDRGSLKAEENAQATAARAAKTAAPPVETPAPARERIAVSSTNAQPRLNPTLAQAYALLQTGKVEEAHALYTKVSQSEPLNIDALLGLAYIAGREHRSDEATQLYVRILQLNPRHALAQAGLISLMGRADPAASESRLKQLIAREPSAFLHFVLGNVYAEQSQWSQAQQSYFQAHHLEPGNPDYAYNLAVGLDHLRQAKLALNYYRRAEQLASTHGRANFSLDHVRERISVLTSQLE